MWENHGDVSVGIETLTTLGGKLRTVVPVNENRERDRKNSHFCPDIINAERGKAVGSAFLELADNFTRT